MNMKYLKLLVIIITIMSCGHDDIVDTSKIKMQAKLTQYKDIVKFKENDTATISCYMGSINYSLKNFKINFEPDIIENGWFAPCGATSSDYGYFDENLEFLKDVKNIVVNYSFIVPKGEIKYSFTAENQIGEIATSETKTVLGMFYNEGETTRNISTRVYYLYTIKKNKIDGDYYAMGADITDLLMGQVDFYYGVDKENNEPTLFSPHSPNDKSVLYKCKQAYYNENNEPRSKRKTLYLKMDNIDFENITKSNFDNLDFAEATHKIVPEKNDIIAFKNHDGIVGFMKVTRAGGYLNFKIKYI